MQASPMPHSTFLEPLPNQSRQLFLLLGLGLLGACGSPRRGGGDGEGATPAWELVLGDNTPADYVLADPACQNEAAPVALTASELQLWRGTGVVSSMQPLANLHTDSSLSGKSVNHVLFQDTYERHCDLRRPPGTYCHDDHGVEKDWVSAGTGRSLRICRDHYAYPSNSFEAIGLSSLTHIERTGEKLRQLAPQKAQSLPVLSLNVLPHFIDYYDYYPHEGRFKRLQSFVVDNMAYFPRLNMIVAFPEKRGTEPSASRSYWYSPFVLAHEFSHHVELAANPSRIGLAWNPIFHEFEDTAAIATGLSGHSQRARLSGALSEAFADLLAFYALDGDTSSLVGLPCIGHNRDVTQDHFANQDSKILTEDRLDFLLNGGYEAPEQQDCNAPRYGDIHTTGAIFAHQVDRVLALLARASLPAGEAGADPAVRQRDFEARYRLLLAWLDRLHVRQEEVFHQDPGGERTGGRLLEPVADSLADLATATLPSLSLSDAEQESLRAEICQSMREGLPSLPKLAFATPEGLCR